MPPDSQRPWHVRLALWPLDLLWLSWVALAYAVETLLVFAMIGVAGAILWFPAAYLDAKLGAPIFECGIIAVTTAAACGFLRGLVKTAVAKWNDCPW